MALNQMDEGGAVIILAVDGNLDGEGTPGPGREGPGPARERHHQAAVRFFRAGLHQQLGAARSGLGLPAPEEEFRHGGHLWRQGLHPGGLRGLRIRQDLSAFPQQGGRPYRHVARFPGTTKTAALRNGVRPFSLR